MPGESRNSPGIVPGQSHENTCLLVFPGPNPGGVRKVSAKKFVLIFRPYYKEMMAENFTSGSPAAAP